jgi:hypothetical protein
MARLGNNVYETLKRITHSHADQAPIPVLTLRERSQGLDQIPDQQLAAHGLER